MAYRRCVDIPAHRMIERTLENTCTFSNSRQVTTGVPTSHCLANTKTQHTQRNISNTHHGLAWVGYVLQVSTGVHSASWGEATGQAVQPLSNPSVTTTWAVFGSWMLSHPGCSLAASVWRSKVLWCTHFNHTPIVSLIDASHEARGICGSILN
ncbi:hypothetical protein E2C01_015370 [Portunus trituberculatus]|uniref:Uncharacterized protein n=1 Tax=Portunus trituberculatus TaxID=210409 RepID=A0A5B7DN03_PORTR|nr:hypothetical protein [Portunus trituberculatus]